MFFSIACSLALILITTYNRITTTIQNRNKQKINIYLNCSLTVVKTPTWKLLKLKLLSILFWTKIKFRIALELMLNRISFWLMSVRIIYRFTGFHFMHFHELDSHQSISTDKVDTALPVKDSRCEKAGSQIRENN